MEKSKVIELLEHHLKNWKQSRCFKDEGKYECVYGNSCTECILLCLMDEIKDIPDWDGWTQK